MECPICEHENRPGAYQCELCLMSFHTGATPLDDDTQHSALCDAVDTVAQPDSPCLNEGASLQEVVQILATGSADCVLVTDPAGQLTGILSERDILNKVAGLGVDLESALVEHYMTPCPDTVSPDASLTRALQRMQIGGFRHLPLVDALGRPTGIVTSRDIVDHVAASL